MSKIHLGQTVAALANIGVVVGLALLAMEINQANRQAEADAYQQRMTEVEHARQQFALSEALPAIYVKIKESGLQSLRTKLSGIAVPDAGFQAEIDEAALTAEQIDVPEVDW